MAIVFELVVNFGRDEEAVAAATGELDRHPQIELRDTPLRSRLPSSRGSDPESSSGTSSSLCTLAGSATQALGHFLPSRRAT
jgi:hypothetical protein